VPINCNIEKKGSKHLNEKNTMPIFSIVIIMLFLSIITMQ